MAAYLIADVQITDPEQYEEYKRQVSPLIARFGGRYLARGGQHEVLEGDWEPHRMVLLEFPDMASLKKVERLGRVRPSQGASTWRRRQPSDRARRSLKRKRPEGRWRFLPERVCATRLTRS